MEVSESILNKIRKLKALSEGAANINSIAESESAALAVNRLLTKYNLSIFDIEETSDKTSITIEQSDLISVQNQYGRQWKERLLMVLCRFNYCKVIACSYKVFILGTQINTVTVVDLFNSLQSVYIHNAKKSYDNDKQSFRGGKLTEKYKRKYITSYLLGCSIGLSVKLEDIKSTECTALTLKHDGLIDEYINENLKVKRKPLKAAKTIDSAYTKGYHYGKNSSLNKTINSHLNNN